MLCSRVQKLLSAYCDSELTGVETLRVRAHVDECAACGEELEGVRQVKQLLGSARAAEPVRPFDAAALDTPVRHPFWQRSLVRALRLDELVDRCSRVVAAWRAEAYRVFHSEVNLALVGAVAIVVLSAAVIAKPQPPDAVSAHVPEYVAADYPAPPVLDPNLLPVGQTQLDPDPLSRFRPVSGFRGTDPRFAPAGVFRPVNWRGR